MPQFITENEYMNRKVKYQSVVPGIVTFVVTAVGLLTMVKPDMAAEFNVDAGSLTVVLMGIAGGIAGVVTVVSAFTGYFTSPGKGDGVKEIKG